MALTKSASVSLGLPPPAFSLPGVDGKTYSVDSFADGKALMVVFMCNHCPYVLAWIDRIAAIARDFAPKGLRTVAISSNDPVAYPADSFPKMKEFAKERKLTFPYLFDESQDVARAYDATCTPDVFVYDAGRRLAYHGRVDDHHEDPKLVKKEELREAVAQVLAGKAVKGPQEPSMGCNIKWRG
jgi:peroxiredoxin